MCQFHKEKKTSTLTYRYTNFYCIWNSSQTKCDISYERNEEGIYIIKKEESIGREFRNEKCSIY